MTQKKNITLEDFDILNMLGSGGYGKVVQVKKKDNGKIYAMKIIKKSTIKGEERFIQYERTALQNINPFLVHLQYSFQTADSLCFVMDFIPGGNLMFHLRKSLGFPKKVGTYVAAELLLAIEYLHSVNIIYRDLKPENVLIDGSGHVCLTDFGLSKSLGDSNRTSTIAGTLIYMAPEVLKGEQYGTPADWWSYGVLVYLLLTGCHPFYAEDKYEVADRILRRPLNLTDLQNEKATDLITQLLRRNPYERLNSPKYIKQHPFFKEIEWDKLSVKKIKPPFKITVKEEMN